MAASRAPNSDYLYAPQKPAESASPMVGLESPNQTLLQYLEQLIKQLYGGVGQDALLKALAAANPELAEFLKQIGVMDAEGNVNAEALAELNKPGSPTATAFAKFMEERGALNMPAHQFPNRFLEAAPDQPGPAFGPGNWTSRSLQTPTPTRRSVRSSRISSRTCPSPGEHAAAAVQRRRSTRPPLGIATGPLLDGDPCQVPPSPSSP